MLTKAQTIRSLALALACFALPAAVEAASMWKVVKVDGVPSTGATFEISAGRIAGTGGCNRYSAPAKFVRGMAEIGEVASTRMACDAMESEQAFFSALQRVRSFKVENGMMFLFDSEGQTAVTLSR